MIVGMGVKAKDIAAAPGIKKSITCCVCNGAKKRGRKNRPCKTCKGTGVLAMEKFEGLFGIVKQELASYVEDSVRDVMKKYAVAPKPKVHVEEALV